MATETFTSNGSWTCPAGCTEVQIECWAGGASGFNGVATYGSAGGGGGAYSKKNSFSVTASSSYSYVVGSGGAGTTSGANNGGDTYFNSTGTVLAKGGSAPASYSSAGAGGSASSGVGDTKYSGGDGYWENNNNGFGGGGGAGNEDDGSDSIGLFGGDGGDNGGGEGGMGSILPFDNGGNGSICGGGGGGAVADGFSLAGGSGARGKIIITYSTSTAYQKELSETINISEYILYYRIWLKEFSETITNSEVFTKGAEYFRVLTETITNSEVFTKSAWYKRELNDSMIINKGIYDFYSEENQDSEIGISNWFTSAQCFRKSEGGILDSAKFYIRKTSESDTYGAVAYIYAYSGGTFGVNAFPGSQAIAISEVVTVDKIGTEFSLVEFKFDGDQRIYLEPDTIYFVGISQSPFGSVNQIKVGIDETGETHEGNASYLAYGWVTQTYDNIFYVYTEPAGIFAKSASYVRELLDTITNSDVIETLATYIREFTETITNSEVFTKSASFFRTLSESITNTESILKIILVDKPVSFIKKIIFRSSIKTENINSSVKKETLTGNVKKETITGGSKKETIISKFK